MSFLEQMRSQAKQAGRLAGEIPEANVPPVPPEEKEDTFHEVSSEMHDIIFGEGDSEDDIDKYWGKFRSMAGSPRPGSLLYVLKQPKVGKKEMSIYFSEVWTKRMLPVIIEPTADIPTYILYSTVLPHAKAVDIAEVIWKHASEAENKEVKRYELLSAATGEDLHSRGDVATLARAVLRRHPKIVNLMFPSKTVIKSR